MSPVPGYSHNMDGAFYMRAQWKLCYVIWPKRCDISGKRLWPGTKAFKGQATWTGPGTPVIEYKWHAKEEHLVFMLGYDYY